MPTDLRFHRALRLTAAGMTLFAICAACTYSEGERAAAGGACPEGETCSDASPGGLVFYGALPGENPDSTEFLRTVAVGGTQRLSIVGHAGEPLGAIDADSSASWVFTVTPDEGEVELGEHAVEVRGVTPGDAYVRVLEPGTRALHDRVLLRVDRVSSVDANVVDTGGVRAGLPASVVFRLWSEQGDRLVDQSLTIESEDVVEHERVTWDCIDFDAPSDRDEVTFVLRAGHRRWSVTIPVVR